MAGENRAEFVLALDGDDSALRGIFNAFKRTISEGAAELERTTGNITLFRGLKENLDRARSAVVDATTGLAKLREQVKATQDAGGEVGKDLAKNLRDAERAVASANKEFAKQEAAVAKMAKSLEAAGVNTKSLATEEIRLATAAKQAAAEEANRQAAATLGIKLSKDTTAEIQKQVAAFNTLKASGAVTTQDLANAQKALAKNVGAATQALQTGKASADNFASGLTSGLASALLPLASVTAAVGALVSTFKSAIEVQREFKQGLAEIGTVTTLTKGELDALGEGARQIAVDVGIGVNDALKGLFDLIRSGVPKDNALEVLRVSAEAAKAALADTADGVKVANLLIDSFGATASELPALFDKIVKGAHEGGATFKEFAASAGPLLNVARAAGISFDDLLAVLTVLVDKSGNVEKSFADLTKVLVRLDTVEVKRKLEDLGITGTTLSEIFRQIGERGLTLQDVLGLQLATGGAKSAAALATLTQSASEVPEKLEKIRDSAGEAKRSLDALSDAPKERTAKFKAAWNETLLGLIQLFERSNGSFEEFQALSTSFLGGFNRIVLGMHAAGGETRSFNDELADVVATFSGIPLPAEAFAASLRASGDAADQAARQLANVEAQTAKIKDALTGFNTSLLAGVQALQSALARDIADATARADAEIAQLSRRKDAEAATAAATIAIRTKLAKDTFALIEKAEADITAAITAANAARERAARASGESQKKIDADTAAARLAAISSSLAAYQRLYADLTNLAQTAALRIQGFEEARVSIAQRVEAAIREIRLEGLSGLDVFVARQAEVDRLISEGRRKAAEGDTEAAKKFFEQALDESNKLTKVVDDNGVVVVSALQAQTAKLEALKKVQDASNEAFSEQAAAAKSGADAAIEEAGRVASKIVELQATYDELKRSVAAGLQFKIETDEASVSKAFATLDELTRPRTVTVTVKTVNEAGAPVEAPAGTGFARGGLVGRRARRAPSLGRIPIPGFARGGPVFRPPTWSKVPGSGSGDTVPAALQAGSFVIRRAASRYYGDGILARLARGYAAGGTVTQDEVRRWALSAFGFDPFSAAAPGGPGDRQIAGSPGLGAGPKPRRPGDPLGSDQSVQPTDPPLSFDTRPVPDELITAANVVEYAREMLNMVGQTNPLLGALLPAILDGIRAVEARPGDRTALLDLLRAAETIGSNPFVFSMWGKTVSSAGRLVPTWFVDWLRARGLIDGAGDITSQSSTGVDISEAARRLLGAGVDAAGPPSRAVAILGGLASERVRRLFGGFAAGGAIGSDTVPAMLTPGEWIVPRRAVRRYGTRLLSAINAMAIPRFALGGIATPPIPVSRFADGGRVGTTAAPSGARDSGIGAPSNTININASAGDLLSEANVRRYIVPVFRDMIRKANQS